MAVATTDWRTFAWGSTTNGQLGVGAIENENVNVPSVVQQLSGREIRHIACGRNHTLFVLSDGTVYSCGSNDCGQLGRENQRSRPLLITLLETQTIQLASAGDQHSIAVTESGQVFAWGDNTHGQLGVGFTDETHILSPKLIKKIEKLHVLQVACGSYHTLALTDIGHIFAWGRNTNCQLGLGYFSQKEDTPHHIACLQGLVVKQITCGGDHSCALSVSGSLYCWGKNNFGQLGIGTTEDSKKPAACITLQNQEAQVVACGHDHTAVLTLDGGVFTFGSGMYGQLGHNCTNNEARPRKIFEMMGYNASQIACGRCHTLVYVPSSGVVYAFGLGANGQQGGGSYKNNQIPAQVKASLIPVHGRNNRDTSRVVHRLHAGGDQSFVTTSNPQSERLPVDYRLLDDKHSIPTWTTEKLNTLASYDNTTKVPDTVNRLINRLFSAPTCLNGSFLLDCDRHTNICSKHSGVDFDAAQTFFTSLGNLQNPAISKAIISLIDQHLLQSPGFGDQCKNAECLRGLLTLPLCHVFTSFEQHFLTICKCAERIVALDDEMGKILDSWWSHIPAEYFARLVSIFKGCVRHILFTQSLCPSTHQKNMKACLDVLKKLNVINNGKRQIVSYELFYIHKLHEVIKIPAVYQHWIECKVNNKRSPGLQFCDYPFIFDGSGKTLLLQADANFQMQVAVYHEVANNPFMLLNPQSKNVYLQLNVNRNDMINDTVLQLTSKNFQDYKKPLRVEFKGEEAMDAGGVKKEFFLLLLRDILDPVYGMFTYKEDSRLLWFNNQAFEGPDMYMLIGVLCGLAIYNSTIIAINFPLALYKKLLKRPITLDDIKELEPSVGRSFQSILDYEGDDFQEAFDITFEWGEHVFGSLVNKELIPGGKDIPVTQENKEQYVDAYIDYRFHKSVDNSFKPFFMGFHRVCGGDVLELFHPQELQALIVGNESYDWEMLEKNCEYKHGYAKTDRPIKYFWNVFHNLELEDKKKFLAFLTGSNRIPITGMKSLQMLIQPMAGADDSLPVAHTCFNLMDLPRYSTEQILQHKLLLAIQHCEGFGLV